LDSDTACPKGGEHKLVDDIPGEKSCTKCGITIIVHEGTGDNPVIDDHGLGSHVGKDGADFRRIARYLKFVPGLSFAKEVALAERQIEICSPDLLKPRLRTRALALFKKTRKPLKGKNFETFVGACIFIACREQEMPIHLLAKSPVVGYDPEEKRLFSWKDTKLVKYYKEICNHLEINLPPDKAVNNLEWIGERVEYRMDEETLKLPGSVIREATKLLSKVPDSETGSNPVGIAAAMLYIVSVTSGHPFTQKQFAEAAKVNSQTVTKSAKRLNSVIKKNKLGKYVDHNTRYHRIV